MAKLEAMLEQRGIATAREMSEAIARCQLHGGDLTTSLLQFVSADEALLSAALSECYGLPAAVVGALPAADDGALRSLPREVAERYCCFPLEATPGRLVLAVAHPLELALKEELEATLGVVIEERVALEVRIRQALSRHYGLPLSARNQRGIARLDGDFDGAHETPFGLWSEAPLSSLPRPPSELPPSHRDSPRPPSARPRSRNDVPRSGTSSAPPSPAPKPSRRREPMPLERAREELGRASTRNDVLDVFFGFACQFFEYSALFAVHSALAEGLDAWGKGADREAVLGIGVPLDLPSSLSEAAESCKVRLTRLGKEGIDRTLAVDLQRQFNAKALLLPVSLRGRCAVLLYADNGSVDVVERDIADVIAISSDVANALGRIILQRKKEASRSKEPAEGASLAPRRSQPASQPEPATRATPETRALATGNEALGETRAGARPSTPAVAPSSRGGVQTQPVVSIGPDTNHVTRGRPSPTPASAVERSGVVTERPSSGDDPVFLLARPQAKAHASNGTVHGSSLQASKTVQRPEVSITVPARLVASGPRLPSVIVDPESADPEASERATRAAAVTRAPTQARGASSGRRPFLPPPADVPRRGSDDPLDPRLAPTSPPAARLAEANRAARAADAPAASRPIEAPSSVRSLEPAPARVAGNGLMPPAVSEVDPDSLEDVGNDALPRSDVWPPPIMDHSPPPPHQPLTALVPIIIADPPKNRRGMINARAAAAARSGVRRPAPSNPPGGPRRDASPTVPSPARGRAPEPTSSDAAFVPGSVPTVPSALGASSPDVRLRDAETIPAARRDEMAARRAGAAAAARDDLARAARLAAPSGGVAPVSDAIEPISEGVALNGSSEEAARMTTPSAVAPSTPAPERSPAASAHEAVPEGSRAATAREAVAAAASLPTPDERAPKLARTTTSTPAVVPTRPAGAAMSSRPLGAPIEPFRLETVAAPPSTPNAGQSSPAAARATPRSVVPVSGVSIATAPHAGSPGAAFVPERATPGGASGSAALSGQRAAGAEGPSSGTRSSPPAAPLQSGHRLAERAADATTAAPPRPGAGRAADTSVRSSSREAPAAPLSRAAVSAVIPTTAPGSAVLPTAPAVPPRATPSDRAPASLGSAANAATASGVSDSKAPSAAQSPPWRPAAWGSGSRSGPSPSQAPASLTQPAVAPPSSAPASGVPSSAAVSADPAAAGERPAIFPPPPPGGAEIEELVESVCQGDMRAVQDLARIGAPSLPQVMARFPGPVISERPSSRASECGPLLRALAAIGSPAMPSITKRSEDGDARVRRWATLLLGEMPSLEACRAVVQRLADDEPRVHQAALEAARLLLAGPAAEAFRDTLFEVAQADDAPLTLRLRTLEHVAKLKDSASVPRLVAFLGADVEPIVHKALWALTVVTRHDFGRDARSWTEFWNQNHGRQRIEWLIDALDPAYPRTSKAAAEELREEAGELFGYSDEQSPAERREVQEKFRTWWQGAPSRRRSSAP